VLEVDLFQLVPGPCRVRYVPTYPGHCMWNINFGTVNINFNILISEKINTGPVNENAVQSRENISGKKIKK